MVKVLVIGDSIVNGNSDYEFGGWVNRLKIDSMKYNKDLGFQNLGVSGDDSSGIVKRLKIEIEKYLYVKEQKLILLFSFGTNDSRFSQKTNSRNVPHDIFRNNLNKILKICLEYNCDIIFTGIFKVDESKVQPLEYHKTEFYDNETIFEYDNLIKEFCYKNKLEFIEFNSLLNPVTELRDGLHPNIQGHLKISDYVKDKLNKYY